MTGAGVAWLDIVDNWCNSYNLILVGLLEAVAIGWCFKLRKVLDEINRNTKRFKMPAWWFCTSIKFCAPILLGGFFLWNVITLFTKSDGIYGGYSLASNIIGGWAITILVFVSGFIVKLIAKRMHVEDEDQSHVWDE